jgi:hypothetical protein
MQRNVLRTAQLVLLLATALFLHRAPANADCLVLASSPVAVDDYAKWPGDAFVVDVVGNDYDPDGDPFAITAFSQPTHGTVAYTADFEALLYTPNGSVASDQFTYTISDGQGSATATVYLQSEPPEPPPPPPPAEVWIEYACNNLQCTFTAFWRNIADTPRYFHWNWGDGTTTPPNYNARSALKGFSPGVHNNITVTITFVSGVVLTNTPPLTINVATPHHTCHFDAFPTGLWLTTRLTDITTDDPGDAWDAYQYFWDWGDGNGLHPVDPFSIYQTSGTQYRTNGVRTINFVIKPIGQNTVVGECPQVLEFVNEPPTPTIEAAVGGDGITRPKKSFRFTPSGWDEYYNELTPWEWNFGDGAFTSTSGPSVVEHLYARPGSYTVTLKTTDFLGEIGTVSQVITVPNDPPVVNWKFNCKARVCSFDASGSSDDGGVLTYSWNFGDGSPATQPLDAATTTHTFPGDAPYDVTLTVSDGTDAVPLKKRVTPRNAPLSEALVFYALPPCRAVDTRLGGRPPLDSGVATDFVIAGVCGVPANARAVAANLTVISPANLGYLQIYPSGTPAGDTSALNFTPARSPRANNSIVALGANGAVTAKPALAPSGTTHFVLDVTGYFTSSLTDVAPSRGPLRYDRWGFYPWRIFDSRTTPPALASGTTRYVKARNASILYMPVDAEAQAVVVTTINPSSGGHFVLYPSDLAAAPLTSVLNFQGANAQSNGALTALGRRTNDDLALTYAATGPSTSDFTVDTYGWFAKDATYRYYPIQPCRAADTRLTQHGGPRLTNNIARSLQIQGNCGVPYGAKFAVVTATVIATDGAGSAQVGSSYDPAVTAIQFAATDTIGNTVIAALAPLQEANCCSGDFSVQVNLPGGGGADMAVEVLGYFLPEVNQPPTAAADGATTVVNVPITIDVLANDSDANGDVIKLHPTRAVFNPPIYGTATRASDSSITYSSTLAGTDRFDYEVIDTRGGVSHATVTLNVRATNAGPVAVNDTATTAANSSVTVDVLANDSDPDGDPLHLDAAGVAAKGTTQVLSDRILYTPNEGASGTDTFSYKVADPFGGSASANVTVTLTAINRAPVAVEDAGAVLVGQSLTLDLVANDTDADGDTLALSTPAITEAPALGTAARTGDRTISYVAGATPGSDVFQYSVHDGHGLSARGAVTVVVHRAPVAVNDSATVRPGTAITVNVVANDSDPDGHAIKLQANPIVVAPAGGTAVRASDTSITYTAGTALGTDTLTYEIVDAYGATARAQLSISVNTLPVAVDDGTTVNVNVPVTVNVLANDSDPDGDPLTLTAAPIVIAPLRGTATRASNTSITYTATSGVSDTDVLTYEVQDTRGGTARAKLNVKINRPPVAVADSAVVQQGVAQPIDVLANDTDPDTATTLILDTPAIVQPPTSGTAVVHADGRRITYTPGAALTDSFTYAVIDGNGGRAVGSVSITVNRPPVAVADALTLTNDGPVDLIVTANDTDPDSDVVKLTASPFKTLPAKGTVVRKSDTTITFTPAAGSSGTDTFNVEVTDGRGGLATAAVNLTIHRRPVANADAALVNQDQAITINVVANDTDADGDALSLPAAPITLAPAVGTAVRASNTSITYNATGTGASASAFFDYKVADSRNALSAAAARVTVTINRKPVAVADSAVAINNGTSITINVTANDTDAENDVVKLTASPISRPPDKGTAVRASDTSITYTPSVVGTTTFDYQVVDARGAGPVTGTVTVRIDPPNRPPVANNDTGTASAQNTPLDVNVTANDSDPDGDPITVSFTGTSPNGLTSILSATTIRFTPNSGYAGKTTFQYRIKDSKNVESLNATVTAQIPGEIVRVHGVGTDIPVPGDWNGDGIDDIGIYRPSTQTWYLDGVAPFVWGINQWDLPISGDWDGDGKDEVGLYRDTFAQWFLRTTPTTAFPGTTVNFGTPGWKAVVGDWNGDNKDDLGVFDPNSATFNLQGQAAFVFGLGTDLPVAGDWNKDNKDEVGVYRPNAPSFSYATFYLRHSATNTQTFVYGAHDDRPIAGDFGGVGRDSVGFVQYLGNTWRMNVGATGW